MSNFRIGTKKIHKVSLEHLILPENEVTKNTHIFTLMRELKEFSTSKTNNLRKKIK